MGVHNEFRLDVIVPKDSIDPLAAAIRQVRDDEGLAAMPDVTDEQLVAWWLYQAEGGDSDPTSSFFQEYEYEVLTNGSIHLHGSGNGKLWEADEAERLYAEHGATGSIEGEAEGEQYRVILSAGRTQGFGGMTIYPADATDPLSRAFSAAMDYVHGRMDKDDLLDALKDVREEIGS